MKKVFAVVRSHGTGWQSGLPLEQQTAWGAHAAFMDALEAEGFVVLAGPLQGTSDALIIVHADTPEAIEMKLAADPWTQLDLLRTSLVAPWTLRIGSLP